MRKIPQLKEIAAELQRAEKKFGSFHNGHEGYAVLLEEVDELWEAVRMQECENRNKRMREEAIQVAAMALRFVRDVCDKSKKDVTISGTTKTLDSLNEKEIIECAECGKCVESLESKPIVVTAEKKLKGINETP